MIPAFIESMTAVKYGRWKVRIWRKEMTVEEWYDNSDLKKFVKRGIWKNKKHLAEEVCKLDRVTAVEVLGKNSCGLVLYTEW
jgi:hypothetical protein